MSYVVVHTVPGGTEEQYRAAPAVALFASGIEGSFTGPEEIAFARDRAVRIGTATRRSLRWAAATAGRPA